jgi:HlyD family secretion protein
VTLGNPDSLWMRVYIAAPKLGEVKLGAAAEVTSPGAPGKRFPGRVVEIASHAEFTPRVALTEDEQANLVFGVKVTLAPTGGVLKAGLPAEARILPP